MARDGLAGKVRLFLRVQRAVASPPARPLFNRSCVSLSGARHMVPLPAATPRYLLVAARRGCSDRGRRRLSIREEGRSEGGVAGVRVRGAPAVAPGAEAAGSLDTCPTPPWGLAASPEPSCGGGWRALGDGGGGGGLEGAEGGEEGCALRDWGGAFGVSAKAGPGRGSEGSCIVGKAPREDGRGSGWSARSPASR